MHEPAKQGWYVENTTTTTADLFEGPQTGGGAATFEGLEDSPTVTIGRDHMPNVAYWEPYVGGPTFEQAKSYLEDLDPGTQFERQAAKRRAERRKRRRKRKQRRRVRWYLLKKRIRAAGGWVKKQWHAEREPDAMTRCRKCDRMIGGFVKHRCKYDQRV